MPTPAELSAQIQTGPPPEVYLRLSTSKGEFAVGETLLVRVEFENRGTSDLLIGKMMLPFSNAPSSLQIMFEDEKGNTFPDERWTVEWSYRALDEWWTAVSSKHFYGTEIQLTKKSHEFLGRPGKYKLTAVYVSKGGLTAPVPDRQIPAYRVWEGELRSNSVWITIIAAPKKAPAKQ
jgi:hypothetical protein